MAENSNPLQKFFRQPAIYIKLPSGGSYYPPGVLDIPPNGELPIFPMTAMDEIIARTPDALYNGSTTAELFKSCVPNIKDPWAIPQSDIDLLLIAVRIASYGHDMDMSSTCPECSEVSDFTFDLRTLIDKIKSPDYSKICELGDLKVYFKPMNYQQINENSLRQFEEQKGLELQSNETLSMEDRAVNLRKSLENITKLTVKSMVSSIAGVEVDGVVIEDHDHISEFLSNCDKNMFNAIRNQLVELRSSSEMEKFGLECPECKHSYKQEFTLDQANFFV